MSKFVKVAGAALAVLALATVVADAGPTIKLDLSKFLGCQVAGTPSEFPDDIWIMNKGLGTIAAGTKVHWSVPAASKKGTYVLVSALAPGKGVAVSGVLGSGVEAGKPCSAKAI
jgi:hypothetical protein